VNGILPIALLGVAGFFLYRYYSSPEPTQTAGGGSTGGSTGAGSGSTGSTPSGGGSTGGGSTGAGSGSTGSTPSGGGSGSSAPQLSQAEILKGAAIGIPDLVAAADAQNWRLNVDQWNWYREQGGGAPIDAGYMDALIGGDARASTILASEYRRRLSGQGLGYLVPIEILRWM